MKATIIFISWFLQQATMNASYVAGTVLSLGMWPLRPLHPCQGCGLIQPFTSWNSKWTVKIS